MLRPNKSCDLQLGNTFFPLTWKKPYLTDGKVNVPFYAVGDHYVLTLDYQYEFAPAAEVEALLETIR